MTLVKIMDLAGRDVDGITVDIRSRFANGDLRYPEQPYHQATRITTLKSVTIEKRRDGKWLYWRWKKTSDSPTFGDYSGVRLDGGADDYYLLADYVLAPPPSREQRATQ